MGSSNGPGPAPCVFPWGRLHDSRPHPVPRVVGKPGSLRFRLTRDTVGVMVIKALSMGLGFTVSVVLARLLGGM